MAPFLRLAVAPWASLKGGALCHSPVCCATLRMGANSTQCSVQNHVGPPEDELTEGADRKVEVGEVDPVHLFG